MDILIIAAIVIAAYMAWNIGANDVANSMADAVGSRALTIFWAVILAAICEFCGAVLVGSHVAETIRKGIIDSQTFTHDPIVLARGMVCAMLAAAVWLNLASLLGMPVSTTHSIVGAVAGFGIIHGLGQIHWSKMGQIVASWFISPVAGAIIAFTIFKLISRYILSVEKPTEAAKIGGPVCVFFTFALVILATIYKGLKHLHLDLSGPAALAISIAGGLIAAGISVPLIRRRCDPNRELDFDRQVIAVEKMFAPLVIITSCSVAFAHGANDVANAVGPLAAAVEIVKYNAVPGKVEVEMWILLLGGAGITVGLAMFGYRVMRLVGMKITEITPSRGVAADLAGTAVVLMFSRLGLPISTTHTLVGAIIGVGLARGIAGVDRRVVGSIFASWLATVPIAAALSVAFYLVARWLIW